MNTAIIVAAGSGQRFGGDTPKQFIEIGGKPIVIHTIEKFEACPSVAAIVLVVPAAGLGVVNGLGGLDGLRSRYRLAKLTRIVAGGATRAESVVDGLRAAEADADDLVAVHDGVRPFVTVDEIERVFARATETGAACLVGDVVDTIKSVESGEITGTVDRRTLRRALTPQVFKAELLNRAYEQRAEWAQVTDECYLVERLGVRIATIEGSSRNIKITRPEDIFLAEAYLRDEAAVV